MLEESWRSVGGDAENNEAQKYAQLPFTANYHSQICFPALLVQPSQCMMYPCVAVNQNVACDTSV